MTPAEHDCLQALLRDYPDEVLQVVLTHVSSRLRTAAPAPVLTTDNGSVPLRRRIGRPRGKGIVLTPEVKARIRGLHFTRGLSGDKIAKQLRMARSTVSNFIADERKAQASTQGMN